ncbi:hypothetical protein C095_00905 [Fusobacterium necrophorum subsp. funduliforme B35]|uniref:Uncharacterized protein n=1 Tax=Fusobacterium necrophorum subsp. funduliforme B35 TaxID=1226633 RepID=A0A0B4E9Q5_9FUSO|nr:hypothetical protein C095_00905 [Fusobacterium necrophorum subsp. funduliforme B35]
MDEEIKYSIIEDSKSIILKIVSEGKKSLYTVLTKNI